MMEIRKRDLQGVLDVVHDCLDIQDTNGIKSVLDRLHDLVPFDGAVVCNVEKTSPGKNPIFSNVINHSYNAQWGEVYFENNFIDVDPVVSYSLNSKQPFTWSTAFQRLSVQDRKTRDFITLANDFKLKDGIAHQITNPRNGTLLSLSISHPKNQYFTHLVQHFTPHLNEALQSILKQQAPITAADLSDREREVLKWTSEGKSSWDIGIILNISERTVKFHILNIKNKLNAVNRAHAVAKALRMKIIA
jgi:DNA-binding CsgD family transcriptional regulator